jgi:hypothetical protein
MPALSMALMLMLMLSISMGFTHRWDIAPLQG